MTPPGSFATGNPAPGSTSAPGSFATGNLCRVLVIGVGSIGERHARTFGLTGRCVVSICEPNDALRDKIAAQYGITETYASLDDAIAVGHDAAVICTPAQLHVPMALQLLDADYHLLIEKPLSTSLEGVERLTKRVKAKNRVAAVAYVWRCHPVVSDMKRAIDAGRFGKPLQVIIHCGQHFPTFRPAYREIYYKDHATGGGAIQDALTHMVNLAEWLVGPVDRFMLDADHLQLQGVDVEDTVHMIARHEKIMSAITLTQHQRPNETTVLINCENAAVRFHAHRNRWQFCDDTQTNQWHDGLVQSIDRDTNFINQADMFLDAVQGKHAPRCTLEQGAHTLRVNLAALASLHQPAWQVP